MENFDNVLNTLVAKLLSEGAAEFSQDGLNIKTTYDNGCLNISASFVSPKEDEKKKLLTSFEDYINSLNDEFFLEVAESFKEGQLKEIQDLLDSNNINTVNKGINIFMGKLKEVAAAKVEEINGDIKKTEEELSELIEIRDSYVHVLNKKF